MAFIEKFGPLIGRILIALLYIKSGWGKLTGFEGIVKYIASAGLPMPSVGAVIAILVELPVAIALVVGFKARYAALIMAVFTLAAAILFHNYWTMTDAAKAYANMLNFYKNLSITGGLLFIAAFGPGAYSVDGRKA
ncbi:MAG TPA: DoxX family protein [Ferrovibrio sp.]|uniref:DoxX family protein n=1 Tax=Ferrovibrio sp. TaxID=1917215 RepID=UPI002ED2D4B7